MKGLYCCVCLISIISISTPGFSQTAGDFRSFASGDWNNVNTWERFDGATWVNPAPSTPSSADGVITTIRSNHSISVTSDVSIGRTTVQSGGAIVINSAVVLTLDEDFSNSPLVIESGGFLTNNGTLDLATLLIISPCVVNGQIINSGVISIADPSLLSFESGSVYYHRFATGGSIPSATWNINSTCEINGLTDASPAAPSNLNQSFGNFRWNCTSMGTTTTFNLGAGLQNVQGNLTFTTSNTRAIRLDDSGTGYTLNVSGDFINEGVPIILTSNNTGTATLNIDGNFSMSKPGTASPSLTFGAGGSSNVIINVKGNFTRSAGTISKGSTSGTGSINFTGSGTAQTYSFTGTGSISTAINFSISTASVVDLGTSALTGSGTFTNNGTLRVGSTDPFGAIQTGTSAGNVRVSGLRTYATGSTIVYNGSAAQFTGNGHPAASNVHAIINNPSGVTLTTDLTVTGNLTLTSGNLSLASNTLALEGNFTPNSNFLNVSNTSSLTINGIGAFGTLTTTGSTTVNNFTINRTTSGSVTLGSDLTIAGTLTQTVGDIIFNGHTLSVNGLYSRTNGSLNVDATATLIVAGSGALPSTVTFAGDQALNTLTVNRAGTTLATNSSVIITNLNLYSGTFDNTGTITIATGGVITRKEGSIINNTPAAQTSYDIVYNIASDISTGSEIPVASSALRHVTKTGGALLTLTQALTINGDLTLSNGSLNAGTFSINLKGDFTANAVSTLTSATVTLSGTTTISGGSPVQFGALSITGTVTPSINIRIDGNLTNTGVLNAGTATTTFGGTTSISGTGATSFNNIVINSGGTLTAPSGSMNVAGNFTNNGTFNRNAGTIIFNGTTSISGASSTDFANITITGTLNAPATLSITQNFTNNGTFNRGTGTVVFKGTTIQSIQGTAVTDFNNISVSNTAGPPSVRVESNQNLRGALTLAANSSFDADGSSNTAVFTLISSADDPTSDASIATLPSGASVTGSVTVQRYMSLEGTNNRMYRYISSPVQTPAVSQVQSEIPITGSFTGSSSCSGCGTSQSMFQYDETVITGDVNSGYIDFPANANTETLVAGKGYTIYVRGNVDPVASAGSARWDVRAPINSGTVSLPATYTSSGTAANDGWNLVGNPYPATIDWDAASGWTRTNINNAIYMRDNALGVVASYVGGVETNGGSQYIPMGQGFFVQATGSPTFRCTESVKVAGTQTSFIRERPLQDVLRVALNQGSMRDEAVIRFAENASEGFDGAWDAHKLKNDKFNLSSLVEGGLKLSINALPQITCGTSVNLDISDAAPGGYALEFSQLESFSADLDISIHDLYTDTEIDPRESSTYAFEVTSDSASFGADRFTVSFSYKKPADVQVDGTFNVCQGQQAIVNIVNSENLVDYSLYKNGVLVADAVSGNGGSMEIPVDAANLSAGDNEFVLHYSPSACNSMVTMKPVTIKSFALAAVNATDVNQCGSGSVTLVASGAEEGMYRWYETETDASAIAGAVSSTYLTPELDKSKTYYVSAINDLGCEGERKPVMAVVHQFEDVTISTGDGPNVLVSSYDTGNQWYFNGQAIPGATSKILEANETGLYEVEVKVDECSSRAGREMVISGVGEESAAIRVFPNPASERISVELRDSAPAQASVVTSLGQPAGDIKFNFDGNKMKGEYSFAGRASGLYFIRLVQGNKVINYKIVKK